MGTKTIAVLLVSCLSLVMPALASAQHRHRADAHRRATSAANAPDDTTDAEDTPGDATAAPEEEMPPPSPRPKSEIGLELVFHSHGRSWGSEFDFSPMLRANIQLLDMIMVEARWGLAYASQAPSVGDTVSSVRVGNVWLAGYYTRAFGKLRLRAGLGFTIPLASIPSPTNPKYVVAGLALGGASAARGQLSLWTFAADSFTVALPIVGADYPVAENLTAGAEVSSSYVIYLGDDPMIESNVLLRLAIWGAYHFGMLQAGLRLESVWLPTASGDNAQLSIEPFARIDYGLAFARVGFVMNLDRPLGFAFDQSGYWGLRLEGGVSF